MNPPPLLFDEALASIESKDRTFLINLDNIGVEILVLSSVAFISNIGLLTAESLTGGPNYKYPTFDDEPSPDNDEFIALELIPPPNSSGAFNVICR